MYARVVTTCKGKAEVQLICPDSSRAAMHCGACSMGQKPLTNADTVLADNGIGAKTGDMVECSVREHGELKAAALLFILPLGVFIAVLGIAALYGLGLWQSFLAGTVLLAATFLVLQLLLKHKTYYYIAGIK
ncbi:MAG: SoxR reducing system RseC family protein [Chlorobi bacterium]|nr:SoxR reducing system RseC family protein [Chlorobiota bacterium]